MRRFYFCGRLFGLFYFRSYGCYHPCFPCEELLIQLRDKIEICEFNINFVMSLWLISHKFFDIFRTFSGNIKYLCKYWTSLILIFFINRVSPYVSLTGHLMVI